MVGLANVLLQLHKAGLEKFVIATESIRRGVLETCLYVPVRLESSAN
jgi:hypothetical protein